MYKEHKILGLIGARGGSKGLPDKNIIDCAGKHLIQWTLEAAKGSVYIDRTIVSTDHERIANIAKNLGGDVPFLRPKELATDDSPIGDVIRHAIDWVIENDKQTYDYFLLLQPTSPLRKSKHIDEAINCYFSNKKQVTDTLTSVLKVEQKMEWLMQPNDSGYIDFCFDVSAENPRRQDLSNYYLPNGAIYIANCNEFSGVFYNGATLYYEMPEELSVDVDTQEGLEKAIQYLERNS